MYKLLHEVWEFTHDGMVLHACCLAGPHGEDCRQELGTNARLLTTFEAESQFEAMRAYNRYLNREEYTTVYAQDHLLYPADWYYEQRRASNDGGGENVDGCR